MVIAFTPDIVMGKGGCVFSLAKEKGLVVKALFVVNMGTFVVNMGTFVKY